VRGFYDWRVAGRTLLDVLQHGAAADPAIIVPGGARLTYRDLRDSVASAADYLAKLGVGRDDRVALVFTNSVEAIVLFLAASAVGTAAPLNAAYKEEEFRFYLQDTGARVLAVPPGQGETARRAMPAGVSLVEAHLEGNGKLALESDASRDSSRTAGSARGREADAVERHARASEPRRAVRCGCRGGHVLRDRFILRRNRPACGRDALEFAES